MSEVPIQAFRVGGVPSFYAQRVEVGGFPIVAAERVNPYALEEAAHLVGLMIARQPDILAALVKSGARMNLLAWNEFTTDHPEFKRFADNGFNDHDHNHVHLRSHLVGYDPGLAAIRREVFGDTGLTSTKPTTRLTGHLAGYDPATAPTFTWPERLTEAKKRIREQAEDRGKEQPLRRRWLAACAAGPGAMPAGLTRASAAGPSG